MSNSAARHYRVVCGTLVPNVQPGNGPACKRLPPEAHDRSHYHHPVVAINEEEWRGRWNRLRGVPLIFEHGRDERHRYTRMGNIVDSTLQHDGALYIVASVSDDDAGHWAGEQIEQGAIQGFSVGYKINKDRSGQFVESKDAQEVSLVLRPFFPEAQISVCASDRKSYNTVANNDSDSAQYVSLFSMETTTTTPAPPAATNTAPAASSSPPAAAVPASTERNPAREIDSAVTQMELKQLREEKAQREKELAEMKKVKDEEQRELLEYRAARKAQQDREAQAKLEEAKASLDKMRQALGVNELPKEFEQDVFAAADLSVRMHENDKNRPAVVAASQMNTTLGNALYDFKEKNDKLTQELEKLKQDMQARADEHLSSADRVRASIAAVYKNGATDSNVAKDKEEDDRHVPKAMSVQGSGGGGGERKPYLHGSNLTDLIHVPMVKPNTPEGNQYQRLYDNNFNLRSYEVNASNADATIGVPALPTHKHLSAVPNSSRFRVGEDGVRYGEALLSHEMNHYRPNMQMTPKSKIESSMTTMHTF